MRYMLIGLSPVVLEYMVLLLGVAVLVAVVYVLAVVYEQIARLTLRGATSVVERTKSSSKDRVGRLNGF